MGVVKFDLKADEVKFKDFCLNSVEDIYEFMNVLDIIYSEHLDGNVYATCLYVDFCKLMNSITDNFYIKEFYKIQIGEEPISGIEISQGYVELNEVAAFRLYISVDEFLEGLHKNIVSMAEYSHFNWLNNVNSNYKNKLIKTSQDESKRHLEVDYERLKEIDALMKYSHSNRTYQGELPSDVQDLYEYRDKLIEQIKYLEKQKKKYHKKDNKRYFEYKQRASKIKKFKIQVDKDISILKRHYGIAIENRNQRGQVNAGNNISYNVNNGDVISAHENYICELKCNQFNDLLSEIYVGKIRKVAENCLTSRQYIIFDLYYSLGLTQREIADILDIPKQNVNREMGTIKDKIILNY